MPNEPTTCEAQPPTPGEEDVRQCPTPLQTDWLPADVGHFVSSAQHAPLTQRTHHGIALITGGPGVGKTCLAIRCAHAWAKYFPDGRLIVDMHGFSPGNPVSTDNVTMALLEQLGEARTTAGESREGRRMRFLRAAEARRLIIVLDNAPDGESVLPLVPRSGNQVTIITSRRPLGGLMAVQMPRRKVVHIRLKPLSDSEARELFAAHLGEERMASSPEATEILLRVCGGIPLAITILAAHLRLYPDDPLSSFTSGLSEAEGRLDLLDLDEPRSSMRTVFSWTYERLDPALQEAFVLFGAAPVRRLDVRAAEALFSTTAADRRLRRLRDLHLVHKDADGRFRMHDLLRDYAVSLHRAGHFGRAGEQGNERLIRYFAERSAPTASESERWTDPDFDALVTAATYAADHEQVSEACIIAEAITEPLWRQGRSAECADMLRHIIDALSPSTPAVRTAHFLRQLAISLRRTGRFEESAEFAERSLTVLGPDPDLRSSTESHYVHAVALSYGGRHGDAVPAYRRALEGFRQTDDQSSLGDALNGLGWSLAELGAPSAGLPYCLQALDIHRRLNDENNEAADLDSIACIHGRLGDHSAALAYFGQCLDIYRRIRHRPNEARTLDGMGDASSAGGDPEAARTSWLDAAAIMDEIDRDAANEIRNKADGTQFPPSSERGIP
ncbi:tetratricopeptide repeat protein [Nocardiopsis chromatogenes]|uniref:tetratricopeptide repeat protein n=1 Tax=Nocardiopsis chromatogenes TaxID=280239 RepID=UPI00034A8998|nr:tetratricopeptide repeat protein [Nocardiopsis chromatogenes]